MAQRSPVRAVQRRNRRLTRILLYLGYAGAVIVAVAQVIAALGQIIDFLHRMLGALGLGAVSWAAAGLCEPRHAPEKTAVPMPAMVRPRRGLDPPG
jgi:hypothetical protein